MLLGQVQVSVPCVVYGLRVTPGHGQPPPHLLHPVTAVSGQFEEGVGVGGGQQLSGRGDFPPIPNQREASLKFSPILNQKQARRAPR